MARAGAPHWQCISGCGACCRLDPAQRSEAIAALSDDQRSRYLAMVGEDGWCIHYDTGGRRCRIYAERPDFCQVSNLIAQFGSGATPTALPRATPPSAPPCADPDSLAIACCLQQIRAEYGGRGRVMRRFLRAIRGR